VDDILNAEKISGSKFGRKREPGRPRRRWEVRIAIYRKINVV
jgi:hypothetical protein